MVAAEAASGGSSGAAAEALAAEQTKLKARLAAYKALYRNALQGGGSKKVGPGAGAGVGGSVARKEGAEEEGGAGEGSEVRCESYLEDTAGLLRQMLTTYQSGTAGK